MKKLFFLIILFCYGWQAEAQVGNILQRQKGISNGRFSETDSISDKFIKVKILGKTKFTDYKIISHTNDTTFVDTTLTIQKEYLHNYRLKDNFELMPFENMGQTYTQLAYNFNDVDMFPILGARAKRFNFYSVKDIKYYRVPTPTSIFKHKTGFQQGQMLSSLLTMNTSPRLNFSLAYKGLRSLGFYRNELSSQGNFRLTLNYRTKNDKYSIRGHMVSQDIINNENGGLVASDIALFVNNDPQFIQRSRLDVNLSGTLSVLRANRYYFEQDYKIWQHTDSVSHKKSYLRVGHVFNYQLSHYEFSQSVSSTDVFGNLTGNVSDKLVFKKKYNQVFLGLKAPIVLGEVKFKLENYNYDYSYAADTTLTTTVLPNKLKGNSVAVGGEWHARLKGFRLNVDASNILTGPLSGNKLKAEALFKKDSAYQLKAGILITSKSPNFNFLLNRSHYDAYNWLNDLKNQRLKNIHASIITKKYGTIEAQFNNIGNYTYFGLNDATTGQTTVQQASNTVRYFRIKIRKSFKKGKFGLVNTVLYNNVSSGSDVFRVPDFVTRNTLYYENYFFKGNPLFLQTGITFKYFAAFFANNFNPLLNEFSLQNDTKIGGFPLMDFFINAQIQRTRIFLKVENFNGGFTGYNYFSAPGYPFRDLSVRFGLVWNFFI